MDFIFEVISEVIVVWVLGYPGAFIRWGFGGFKKGRFQELAKEDGYINSLYLILTVVTLTLILYLLF